MRTLVKALIVLVAMIAASVSVFAAPSVDSLLAAKSSAAPMSLSPVVITFDHSMTSNDFLMLQSLGIRGGYYTKALPIALTSINRTQFNALKAKPGVRSLYANRTFHLLDLEGRTITGIENLIRDGQVTALNNGLPVTGKNIGVSYIDTGIDATHPDLQLGQNVAQNVYYATADLPIEPPAGFLPVVPVENVPITDIEGGHGTFGAGVTAGTGVASAGLYKGMAPGAKLVAIRAGNDVGLTTFAIVQAMDYTLVNQYRYNIRVCNNSWGTTLADNPYDPNDPINTATRMMHDRNITVVFAAGNDGDAPNVINPFSVAPWVISVAANDLSTIPPAYLPYYTTSQGTSFSTPQVSGIVALMLEANPLLTPDQVVTLLRQTATPMPYEERVVGAGYVDAHNAVRAAMSLTAVPHPANLFPSNDPNAPQIVDGADDQLGTTAQDIRAAYFQYDPVANQIVYRLRVNDASVRTPNMQWSLTSAFGAVEVFVTASVDETATTFEYGKITTLATGTQNQETIGATDFGAIDGNEITIKLSLDKVNAAVGSNVLGTTSTNTQAEAQILIGSSLSGGLLLNSDSGTGSNFEIAPAASDPTPTPTPASEDFNERYSGTILPGQSSVEMP